MASKKSTSTGKASATSSKKKSTAKPTSKAVPKPITDADLVKGLKGVQKRKLTNSGFSAVTQTIKLLDKE